MAMFTLVARGTDGLPLVESVGPTASISDADKAQARAVPKELDARSPARMTLDAGALSLHYQIEDGIVYLTVTEQRFPKRLAFGYLAETAKAFAEELRAEHGDSWHAAVERADRAYVFLKFERVLQRLKREWSDPSSRANTARLAEEVSEIQGIMRRNIHEVLARGEKLDSVSRVSARLLDDSKKFKWGAKRLNALDRYKALAPYALAVLIIVAVLYWRFLL